MLNMNSPTGPPSPSTAAIALATGILCGLGGYFLGQGASLGLFSRHPSTTTKSSWPNSYDVTVHPDTSDEELMQSLKPANPADIPYSDSESDSSPSTLQSFPAHKEECKLVLVVRTDLGMSKGKIAAQCSHATLACYTYFLAHAPASPLLKRWRALGQAKVAVQCRGEEELLTLQAQALSLGLCARVIHDAGRTQVASGSATVLGVGPGPKSVVDGVTGGLKLL
ncbi:Gluconate transport-inducing protein [Lambiella insularis]|nr:Gluconate transport-inducing protein [Lambiella insularis]